MACRLDLFFNQKASKHRDELFDGIYSENTEESYVGISFPHSSQLLCVIHVYGLNFFRAFFSQLHAYVALNTTAMTFLQMILHSAAHIYDFTVHCNIFIISSLSFHGFITNQLNVLLPVGLLA